ncbi:DNA-processing protein DprA [Paraclostridium bifermentans]|uniref:DNA-processing protein DprA n=1 Tax=Paraclostridium bifermentans TaxID=1490 RepID=UPI0021C3EF0C|nr:DNA-processing protein DprA [Paraclostridium bifermentans]GKZ08242.1 DNA protecting protein DprA [Paraclostridium bifermentans]
MLTNDDKALILLCSHIGLSNTGIKPLTLKQWNNLASLIVNSNIKRPGNLLLLNEEEIRSELKVGKIESEHIINLLSRSVELGIALERLYSKGIKVVTRANDMYPKKIRKKLKDSSPPVIFYCGNLSLASEDGIGVVGSRNINEECVKFTKELVQKAVSENLIIYSGGARGIDDTSEKEAFIKGGKYVSFIADSLEAKIKKKDVRDKILTGRALIMTATSPSAPFNVGFAMNRNKYIYSLSKATFIIASDYNKGGTWTGATENLSHNWTKTFIRQDLKSKGIQELIKLGAIPVDDIKNINIAQLIDSKEVKPIKSIINENQLDIDTLLKTKEEIKLFDNNDKDYNNQIERNVIEDISCNEKNSFDLYYCVIDTILKVLKEEKNIEQLSEILNVNKTQVNIWIKRACEEKKDKKNYKNL